MSAGQVAIFAEREAALASEFGMKLAAKYFSPEEIAAMGVYVKGKNAGKAKGVIAWTKCESGGWSYAEQRVYRPGMVSVSLVEKVWKGKDVVKFSKHVEKRFADVASLPNRDAKGNWIGNVANENGWTP